ncbi:GGDEF domain-containing protein [Cohnella cellulosilytica]|uniref:GGDEF domain-containing protein n=1 Tax=Cohnella cellulosilytica TaxID=986710 RepID=A0ABW2FMM2_9BACL
MKVGESMIRSVRTLSSDKSVSYASERMNEWNVNSVVVVDYGTIVGLVTTPHIRSSHPNRIVADAMTAPPSEVFPDTLVWDALKIMDKQGSDHLLVMDEGTLVGLLTREIVLLKLSELRDPLCGLYRSPYIHAVGESMLKKRQPFHLLFVDLNRFGEINKRYGHPFGDDVIREYANRISSLAVKERDYLCRYAGDEFVLITLGDEAGVASFTDFLARPVVLDNVAVSASVGSIAVQSESAFSQMFRDILSEASLLSTSSKPVPR